MVILGDFRNREIIQEREMGTLPVKVASVLSKVNHSGLTTVNEESKYKKEAGAAEDEQKDREGRMVEGVLVNTIQKYFSLIPKLVR